MQQCNIRILIMTTRHASLNNCESCPSKGEGIFCDLNSDELGELARHKIVNKYKKGQTLFVQGNHPYGIYCISTGNIKLTQTGHDGKESLVRVVKGGDVLGHRSLFTQKHYNATATALEDSSVCFIDKKFILKTIQQKPSVSLHIIEKLSRDMGAAETTISSLHQKNVRERLAELLLVLKESHGQKISENEIKISLKLTRDEMATMIGTASETVIRFIGEFKESGLIKQDGKFIIIQNEEELINWANIDH